MIVKVATAWNQGLLSQGWLTGHWQLMDGMDELPTEEFCGYTIFRYAILYHKQLLSMFASVKGHWTVCAVKHGIPANGHLATALVNKNGYLFLTCVTLDIVYCTPTLQLICMLHAMPWAVNAWTIHWHAETFLKQWKWNFQDPEANVQYISHFG